MRCIRYSLRLKAWEGVSLLSKSSYSFYFQWLQGLSILPHGDTPPSWFASSSTNYGCSTLSPKTTAPILQVCLSVPVISCVPFPWFNSPIDSIFSRSKTITFNLTFKTLCSGKVSRVFIHVVCPHVWHHYWVQNLWVDRLDSNREHTTIKMLNQHGI